MSRYPLLRLRTLARLASFGVTMTLAATAFADEPAYDKQSPKGEYTAPLSQTTQPTYVPQSVALSGPKELDHTDGDPVPAGYTPVTRMRKGPLIAGASIFGGFYMLSAFSAAVAADASYNHSNELAALWVPGVGPFIQMASTESSTGKFFLAIDGIGQVTGLALAIYGLSSPKTVLVRNDLAKGKVTFQAVPVVASTTAGVAVAGTF